MRYQAAAVQFEAKPGQRQDNLNRALELVRQAARDGAKLIVLPELFASGYDPALAARDAESVKSGTATFALQEQAKRLDVWIVANAAERPPREAGPGVKPAISTFLIAPEGVSDPYRKIHLWADEAQHFTPGGRIKLFNSRLGRLGPLTCYDVEFPEVARALAVKGAQVLVCPSAFLSGDVWDLATRSRALENGCWLVAAGQVGTAPDGRRFCGGARIVAPDGKVLADAGPGKEGYALAWVDPIEVLQYRKERPYLDHLRKFH